MEFKKQVLAESDQGYSIASLTILGKKRIVAAPEGRGPTMVFSPPSFQTALVTPGPGGCMGFAPLPKDDSLLMITGFYPIFKAEQAGINLFQAIDGLAQPWKTTRIIDLPFVHRIAVVETGIGAFLVAATVCGGKDFQEDWSQPGAVYTARIPDDPEQEWLLEPVLSGLHRNHGMCLDPFDRGIVYVAAAEGVFALTSAEVGKDWKVEHLTKTEASEVAAFDLDGDGELELAVIEPFHGNRFAVYKKNGNSWKQIFKDSLAFGHGLWAGEVQGQRIVIVGNRGDHRDLVCYRVRSGHPFEMDRIVVDPASGTTNLDAIDTEEGLGLIASNAAHGEYALYRFRTGGQ